MTFRQNQCFVLIDVLDYTNVRRSLESQFDAFSLERIQELDVFLSHFSAKMSLQQLKQCGY